VLDSPMLRHVCINYSISMAYYIYVDYISHVFGACDNDLTTDVNPGLRVKD